MKTNSLKPCAVVLLMAPVILLAQKTEVRVKKGKVVAETQAAAVNVDAGQKAVLKEGANPSVTVDSPLVRDALELYKLAEKEKEQGDLRIDSTLIMVIKLDEDEIVGAAYFEIPNPMPEPRNVLTIPHSSSLGDFRIYDISGNLCKVEVKSLGDFAFSYTIHLPREVQPGEYFKLIGVASLDEWPLFPGGEPTFWKEGPLLYIRTSSEILNGLQYRRFILPASAILVDTNRQVVATDTVDGQLAVTTRAYTGPYGDSMCIVAFMHSDEDGTSLADIPAKYHGLRSPRDKQDSEMFTDQMRRIKTGAKPTDQSTPLTALLTCFGSIVHEDIDLHKSVKYTDRSTEDVRMHMGQAQYWADILDLLSTPEWPDNPGNGYVHPIYVCRRGSMICEFIQPSIYHNGQWYDGDTKPGPSKRREYLTAEDIAAAKREGYLCDWEVAGPYVQRGKKGKELFSIAFGPELPDVDAPWRPISVEPHDDLPVQVDLDAALYNYDQSAAYLRTRIVSEKEKPAVLHIYSDDGVKAWLNGKLIHENNADRGLVEPPDKVDVTLNQGANELMLKVTDDIWGWGATVRLRPVDAAGS